MLLPLVPLSEDTAILPAARFIRPLFFSSLFCSAIHFATWSRSRDIAVFVSFLRQPPKWAFSAAW